MAIVELTSVSFAEAVESHDFVLVDWWAAWCGPCRAFGPVFEASAQRHPDIVHAKVDTDAEPDLAATAGIESIPTLMAFRDGILVFCQPGALPAQSLEQVISAVHGLDMDKVREQLAAHRAGRQDG